MYRVCESYVVSYGYIPKSGNIKNIRILLWIPNAHNVSVHKLFMINTAGPLDLLQIRNGTHVIRTGKGPCRREYLRCKRGRWARSRQALLAANVLQQHSVVPRTIHCRWCLSCVIRTKSKLRKRGFAPMMMPDQSSSLHSQTYNSIIMTHPTGVLLSTTIEVQHVARAES